MIGFLTQAQVHELLDLFRLAHTVYMGEIVGTDVMSNSDRSFLKSMGVDISNIQKKPYGTDLVYNMGRLASALRKAEAENLTYEKVKQLAIQGAFRELNSYEKNALDELKNQSYWAIKGLENAVIRDSHDILIKDGSRIRSAYEEIIRDESRQAIEHKKSLQSVMLDIGHRTGDWSRKLSRVVETEMHNTYDRGRAVTIAQQYGEDAMVYKDVKDGACPHCVRLYLENGAGSKPKMFKLSELIANGTNIGRKAKDFRPVIGTTHPYCRCTLNVVPIGYEWDEETRDFSKPSTTESWRKTSAHKMAPILVTTSGGIRKV